MASILSKVSTTLSFGRWLLCHDLVRYLHPTDEELRTLARIPADNRGRGRNRNKNEPFTIPKNLDIQLESAKIRPFDVLPLKFYTEFQWLLDFAVVAIIIYVLTELYYSLLQPDLEFNLSMLWCLLMIGFCMKIMFSLTTMYFSADEGGERILIVIFGLFFLILAMGVMLTNEETLEFGLEPGYFNFTTGAREFLNKQGVSSHGPASIMTIKIILVITAAILGAFLTFPGLRLAKMHNDCLKYTDRPFMNVLFSFNIVTPLFIALMWVKPVMRDFLVRTDHYDKPILLTDEQFEALRLIVILAFCLFRFLLVWNHLQAHLNMACEKVEALKKEAGRISTVELQRLITHVFFYLCVVALQYLAPLILLLFCTLMLKTLGGYSLTEPFGFEIPPLRQKILATKPTPLEDPNTIASAMEDTIAGTAAQFSIAFTNLRQVFTPLFFQGILSFFCWWISMAWFTTTTFGMIYYSYFTS